eukprot:m.195803 g.195803  ORF g.195803 m.195803 type:complete len:981 (+) comp15239_c0_seq1:202-3144(+)
MEAVAEILNRLGEPASAARRALVWCGAGTPPKRPILSNAEVAARVSCYRAGLRSSLKRARSRGSSEAKTCEQVRVALLLDPTSPEAAIALPILELAVISEAAVVVPLNPADPRATAMLATVQAAVAVVSARSGSGAAAAEANGCLVVSELELASTKPLDLKTLPTVTTDGFPCMQTLKTADGQEVGGNEALAPPDPPAAALFFTSGSTGTPKACATVLKALASYARGKNAVFEVDDRSAVMIASPPTFDPAFGDAIATWLAGACLCVARPADIYSDLAGCLTRAQATHVLTTPSLLGCCDPAACPPTLRVIGVGGEAPPRKLVDTWASVVPLMLNVYGVTEACVYQAWARLEPAAGENCRALGRPIHQGCDLLGLEPTEGATPQPLDSLPKDTLFEVVLVGEAVSPRYLGRVSSVGHYCDASGRRGFRTGDIAVKTASGSVILKGRRDGMVKINGVRIECGEVEHAVTSCLPGVITDVCVVAHRRRLWAFCTLAPSTQIDDPLRNARVERALRHLVARVLPRQMVPASVVFTETIPVSANGKADRKALVFRARDLAEELTLAPAPESDMRSTDAQPNTASPPMFGWVALLAQYLAEELGVSPAAIGPKTDFRALSGDSLVALRVCKRLATHVQGRGPGGAGAEADPGVFGEALTTMSPVFFLENPVLELYAAHLSAKVGDPGSADGDDTASPATTISTAAKDAGTANQGGQDVAAEVTAHETATPAQVVPEVAVLVAEAAAADDVALLSTLLPALQSALAKLTELRQRAAVEAFALHAAVGACHPRAVAEMLHAGFDPNGAAVDGVRPLHTAARHGSRPGAVPTIDALLAAGGQARATDANGQNVIHHAARGGCGRRGIDRLLEAWTAGGGGKGKGGGSKGSCRAGGVGCLGPDRWGRTPLHWAVQNGHRTAVVALLEASSDPNAKDAAGETPLQVAERRAQCRAVDRPHGLRPADFGGIAILLGGNAKTVRLKNVVAAE